MVISTRQDTNLVLFTGFGHLSTCQNFRPRPFGDFGHIGGNFGSIFFTSLHVPAKSPFVSPQYSHFSAKFRPFDLVLVSENQQSLRARQYTAAEQIRPLAAQNKGENTVKQTI